MTLAGARYGVSSTRFDRSPAKLADTAKRAD